KIGQLSTELKTDQWAEFFAFIEKDWSDIASDGATLKAFREGSELYARFAKKKPELGIIPLQAWMKEATNYTSLTTTNPTKEPKLARAFDSLKDGVSKLAPRAALAGEAD